MTDASATPVADLLELSCLHYGVRPGTRQYAEDYPDRGARRRRAARILEQHPGIARGSLHAAVVCGDRAEVDRLLALRPAAASEPGGREGWVPLLYLCYGRLPIAAAADNAVAIATALLDHGADPNAAWSYDWDGQLMAWSALCGVIGDGEGGPEAQPPHPRAEALATLLLDRGADPRQGQALYNTMLRGDDERWLRLLIARGLDARTPIPWGTAGGTIFAYLLAHAVGRNQIKRATLLLAHGASAEPVEGPSLHAQAQLRGNLEVAALLERHGARPATLTGREAFRAACMRADGEAARRLLAEDPGCLDDAGALLVDAAGPGDRVEVVRLLLDLGVAPDSAPAGFRALHHAATANAAGVAALLLERGASPDARDTRFSATPLAWALHGGAPATTALLARHTRDVFTLAAGGLPDRLRERLAEDPGLAGVVLATRIGLGLQGGAAGETPLHVLPDDDDRAAEIAGLLLSFGADPTHRNAEGQTPAEKAEARGLAKAAALLQVRG